ncbi:MAG: 16S rRNA (adenine(1518)-N(6)/adenine(1519)-N(6))-dimethyltransferase RsmA [Candidatus Omnitrophota bacterium]
MHKRLSANKRLGQNFLTDKRYIEKILNACAFTKKDSLLEIGPGMGALTSGLALACKRLTAVEFDKRLFSFLREKYSGCENVEIVHSDILKFDIKAQSEICKIKLKVIGNLPYYITTPIIAYLIDNRQYLQSAFITVQKEVAQRLTASPGGKTYGSLSCFVQVYTKPQIVFYIPKGVFYPAPSVESAFVKLDFLQTPAVKVNDEQFFLKVINAGFSKRRKTLANALSSAGLTSLNKQQIIQVLEGLSIAPTRRAETLNLQEFACIAQNLPENENKN